MAKRPGQSVKPTTKTGAEPAVTSRPPKAAAAPAEAKPAQAKPAQAKPAETKPALGTQQRAIRHPARIWPD